jgi:hypothetical protein
MALKSSKVAIEVVIKDIKKIADLKKGLKELRAEQKKQETESKTGQKQSHANAKAYKERAKSIKENSKELRTLRLLLNHLMEWRSSSLKVLQLLELLSVHLG